MTVKKPENVKELCEFIWYLEDKYNLLDFEIEGIKPWQAQRIEIYYTIGKSSGVFDSELKREMTKIEKLLSLKKIIFNSIFHNPFINLKQTDALVFSHPRSKMINSNLEDIYTYKLVEELQKDNVEFLEFESHYKGEHKRKKTNYKRYTDYITLVRNLYRKKSYLILLKKRF